MKRKKIKNQGNKIKIMRQNFKKVVRGEKEEN
jgi:hypothetical protein